MCTPVTMPVSSSAMIELLRHIKDLPTKRITINTRSYPVHVDGTGDIPLLSIGIGSHLQMTLPASLKKTLKVYSTDLYWIASQRLPQPEQLTMSELVDDIIEVISQLSLSQCILAGFSCYGILALEVAKRLDPRIKGIVLVSTPPTWNIDVINAAQSHFIKHASFERKQNDAQRKEHFLKIKKPDESIGSVNAYTADAARYWKDFHLTNDFFELLWQDIYVDDAMINHFFSTLLPAHDLAIDLDKITIPVVLFSGQFDYDSIPLILWQSFTKPSNFTIVDCGQTGHWPQLENPTFFETSFLHWLQNKGSPLFN